VTNSTVRWKPCKARALPFADARNPPCGRGVWSRACTCRDLQNLDRGGCPAGPAEPRSTGLPRGTPICTQNHHRIPILKPFRVERKPSLTAKFESGLASRAAASENRIRNPTGRPERRRPRDAPTSIHTEKSPPETMSKLKSRANRRRLLAQLPPVSLRAKTESETGPGDRTRNRPRGMPLDRKKLRANRRLQLPPQLLPQPQLPPVRRLGRCRLLQQPSPFSAACSAAFVVAAYPIACLKAVWLVSSFNTIWP